ncbi:MAG: dTMP kinase [Alphaproteobacteria bacterium]|jgi:dTMP kinase
MARGRFITFEGGEGAGKSTQAKRLAAALRAKGITITETREPGGSPAAERIRSALLGLPPEDGAWDADAECLLHYAARRQHLTDLIEPALKSGSWVISDRFADSTMAYQAFAGGVDPARVKAVHKWALGSLQPDLTLILDLSVERGFERARARGEGTDVYERRPTSFHEAVRAGFHQIALSSPLRCRLIDADREADLVTADVLKYVSERLDA